MEMSCPRLANRTRKDTEKTEKYEPLWYVGVYQTIPRLQDCTTEHHNGRTAGWSKELEVEMNKTFGVRSIILKRMQEAVLPSSLNIGRPFKVITK